MSRRRKGLIVIAATILILLVAAGSRILPVFTGPPLPAGATRLHITTEAPNVAMGCATALLSPARVTTSGDDLVLVTVESGEIVRVVWPAGFAAWRADGHAAIADPWGNIVGREGDVLDSLSGGTPLDDAFHICPFGIVTEP